MKTKRVVRKESFAHEFGQLKELMSGATMRAISGIAELAAIAVGTIQGDGGGDPNQIHDKKRDVWTWFKDGLSGLSVQARLWAPAGILWNLPANGDGAHLFQGRKQGGPGGALVAIDGGDGATDNAVPGWLDDSNAGVSTKKKLHLESTGDDVDIDATATGKTVNVNGTDYPMLKSTSLESDLADALEDLLTGGTVGGPTAQMVKIQARLAALIANLRDGTYESQKAKNG